MDWKLELIQVPVSDIDRAKAFYTEKIGFTAEHDHQVNDELRFVQLTPPGSACSIALTSGAHEMQPGSIDGLQLVVDNADGAREELLQRGVEVGDVRTSRGGGSSSLPTPTATPGRFSGSPSAVSAGAPIESQTREPVHADAHCGHA